MSRSVVCIASSVLVLLISFDVMLEIKLSKLDQLYAIWVNCFVSSFPNNNSSFDVILSPLYKESKN